MHGELSRRLYPGHARTTWTPDRAARPRSGPRQRPPPRAGRRAGGVAVPARGREDHGADRLRSPCASSRSCPRTSPPGGWTRFPRRPASTCSTGENAPLYVGKSVYAAQPRAAISPTTCAIAARGADRARDPAHRVERAPAASWAPCSTNQQLVKELPPVFNRRCAARPKPPAHAALGRGPRRTARRSRRRSRSRSTPAGSRPIRASSTGRVSAPSATPSQALLALADEHGLCRKRPSASSPGAGPCFAAQLNVAPPRRLHRDRVAAEARPAAGDGAGGAAAQGLAVRRRRRDPRAAACERPRRRPRASRDWCWLGTARDDAELQALLDAPPRPQFDADIARLLMRTLARGKHEVFALPAGPAAAGP